MIPRSEEGKDVFFFLSEAWLGGWQLLLVIRATLMYKQTTHKKIVMESKHFICALNFISFELCALRCKQK